MHAPIKAVANDVNTVQAAHEHKVDCYGFAAPHVRKLQQCCVITESAISIAH